MAWCRNIAETPTEALSGALADRSGTRSAAVGPRNTSGAARRDEPHGRPGLPAWDHNRAARRRRALPTTVTDESAIAAAAMIGERSIPKVG